MHIGNLTEHVNNLYALLKIFAHSLETIAMEEVQTLSATVHYSMSKLSWLQEILEYFLTETAPHPGFASLETHAKAEEWKANSNWYSY